MQVINRLYSKLITKNCNILTLLQLYFTNFNFISGPFMIIGAEHQNIFVHMCQQMQLYSVLLCLLKCPRQIQQHKSHHHRNITYNTHIRRVSQYNILPLSFAMCFNKNIEVEVHRFTAVVASLLSTKTNFVISGIF